MSTFDTSELNTIDAILEHLVEFSKENDKKAVQRAVEQVYSKRNIRKLIKQEIATDDYVKSAVFTAARFIEDWVAVDDYLSKNLEKQKLLTMEESLDDMVVDMLAVVLQQGDKPFEMTKVVSAIMACTPFGEIIPELDDDTDTQAYIRGIKCSCSLLVVMAEANLIDVIPAFNAASGKVMVQSAFTFDGEVGYAIERAKFLPPLISQPKTITANNQSCYLTFDSNRITKPLHQHEEDICLDTINLCNSVKYTLNQEYLACMEDEFEFKTRTADEIANGKKEISMEDQRTLFDNHQLSTERTCNELIALGNEFFFEWFVDYRGRMYDRGYEVHLQGTSHKKAMIDFAEPSYIDGWQMYATEFNFELPEEVEFTQAELDEPIAVTAVIVEEQSPIESQEVPSF